MSNFIESIKDKFKTKQFSARDAYMTAKYNKILSNDKLLEAFFDNTEDLIRTKAQSKQYCAMAEIDVDIKQYTDDIVKHYKKAGFQVLKLTEKTMLNGEKIKNIKSNYIILFWNHLIDENDTIEIDQINS